MITFHYANAAGLLYLALTVAAHGHGEHYGNGTSNMKVDAAHPREGIDEAYTYAMANYHSLDKHASTMVAHIVLMVLAWFFILPIGVMFSIGRSRLALPVQLLFLAQNGIGVLLGTIYNVGTPDLYKNNAHHKIGWLATGVVTAQVVMSLLFLYTGSTEKAQHQGGETAKFLPVSAENMSGFTGSLISSYHDYRWSSDTVHDTERSFSGTTRNSRDISPNDAHRLTKQEPASADDEDDGDAEEALRVPMPTPPRRSLGRIKRIDEFLSKRMPGMLSIRLLKTAEVIYEVINRTILVLGFITLVSGGVTYAGIFRGKNIFNGLAHFVKGGIFVWYGLLTLGRWVGAFSDLGWNWGLKPSKSEVGNWKARMPSAEFVESFVIWLYGSTTVFMEHLAAAGQPWVAQDLEHVSISIMFFGGGLVGMLLESKTIRNWLNTTVDLLPPRTDVHPSQAQQLRRKPVQYSYSLNPMPALIVLLLGVMMSSHHQDSIVSTKVHAQWGTLLVGFSVARGVTYSIAYISPPTSIYPSRPPSELVAAFCLISGGLIFMASTKDIIHYIEESNLMAMFVFTLTMGFTAFLMAYEILVLSLKGWAIRREKKLTTIF